MRLAEIRIYEDANKFLHNYYLKKHNIKFSVPAKDIWDSHTKITKQELDNMEWFFAKNTDRTMRRDCTIRYKNTTYQILKNQSLYWNYRLTVKESMYWNIKIFSGTKSLLFKLLPWR